MAGFRSLKEYSDAVVEGKTFLTTYRKSLPNAAFSRNIWFDNSMFVGMPRPQYYASAPLEAVQMGFSTVKGIFHHGDVNALGKTKYIHRVTMMNDNNSPTIAVLCDYLLYYPFIDTSITDLQEFTNTVSLPRYATGDGVKMMVVSQAPCNNAQPTFVVNYTNSDGVAGRTTPTHTLNSGTYNGAIMSAVTTGGATSSMPFLGLQRGDKGVRSIQSIQFPTTTDVGLLSLVLVRPLMTLQLSESTSYSEKYPIFSDSSFIEIKDNAHLNFIMCPSVNISSAFTNAEIEFIIT